ncbi:MAG: hypothetical protein NT048_07335 [Flavobacterium sp.]|nr:hypothetical protein [Flavobacterium sp.]
MKNSKIKKIVFAISIVFINSSIFAQDISFGDDVGDNTAPTAPIDDYITKAILFCLLYAIIIIFKKERSIDVHKIKKEQEN